MLWKMVGITAALLTMLGFIPQSIKMIRTKSVKDISGLTLAQFSIGVALWMVYGIHLSDFIIIGANAVSLCTLLVTLGFYVKLSRGNKNLLK